MDEIVNLVMNSSMTVVIVAYFIYRDYKFTSSLNEKLTQLMDAITIISKAVKDLEETRRKEVNED